MDYLSKHNLTLSAVELDISYEIHRVWISGNKVTYHPKINKEDVLQFMSKLQELILDIRELPVEELANVLVDFHKKDTYLRDLIYYYWILPSDHDFGKVNKLFDLRDETGIDTEFCFQELSTTHYVSIHLIDFVLEMCPETDLTLIYLNSNYEKFALLTLISEEDLHEDSILEYRIGINMPYFLKNNRNKNSIIMRMLIDLLTKKHVFDMQMQSKHKDIFLEQFKIIKNNPEIYLQLIDEELVKID